MPVLTPTSLNLQQSLRLTANMRNVEGRVEIDCANLGWVEPFGMLLSICCADELRRQGQPVVALNVPDDGYVRHMGFFDNLDPNIDPPRSASRSNEHYMAIVRRPTDWLESEARAHNLPNAQDFIYEYARKFACLLTQTSDEGAINKTLEFCLAEILRNMYEHSQSDEVIVCGQYWPNLSRVDLAVADQGIGLRTALSGNPFLEIAGDADAIRIAMLPGVSGRSYQGAARKLDTNSWENSGYGLWMTSEMCSAIGSLTICSGGRCLYSSRASQLSLPSGHRGTILGLSFDPAKAQPFSAAVNEIRIAGRRIAKKLTGAIIDASAASIALKMGRGSR